GGPLSGMPFSRAVYDADGKLLRLTISTDQKYRKFTSLADMSPAVSEAFLLREDKYFYFHPGVNPAALLKATRGYFSGSSARGASTITMQLARMKYGLETRSIRGKIFQILCAFYLEFRYSKSSILEAYLNLIPLGHNIEGVPAASLIYFGKASSSLNPVEAITLCIIPPSPAKRTRNSSNTAMEIDQFRKQLFEQWIQKHPEDKELILSVGHATLPRDPLPFLAPHFSQMVLADPSNTDRSEIKTTLRASLQQTLERTISNYVQSRKSTGIKNAAALLVDVHTGKTLAHVGSANFADESIDGQVDGTRALRSPGSALKPLLYALAVDRGIIHPRTLLKDTPIQFSTYSPENFEGEFLGPLSAQSALVLSRNVPAIYIAAKLRQPDFTDFLKSSGVSLSKPKDYYGLAPILGGIEISMAQLASLYGALAKGGVQRPVSYDGRTNAGKTIFSPEAAFITLEMLKSAREDGMAEEWMQSPFTIYWKTGTSSGFRDAWTAGIFGSYVLVVWIGNFDGSSNPAFVGRDAALPLFLRIARAMAAENNSIKDWIEAPAGVSRIEVCSVSGKIPRNFCPLRAHTWYIPGKSPIEPCDIHREVAVDLDTGLRACAGAKNTKKEVYEFWPSDIERVLKSAGLPHKAPPRFSPECQTADNHAEPPSIHSPVHGVTYESSREGEEIALEAAADASVTDLFWFVDDGFVGKSKPGESLFWRAHPGEFKIRVVDSGGASDQMTVKINAR
ncbi:MAG TPA: penicillin-binding protein 1C, partial [Leptospiraceae bacterium]|nr:penicillin-binding protein 1C [Leptospiraceae bacterium]